MRYALLALSMISLATPALASGAKAEKAGKEDVGQYVDLVPLALPIVAGGQVRNYIFLRVRVNLTKHADAPKMRDKEPYLRDALVRAGYRTPFTRADTYLKVDEAKLSAALAKDAAQILGPGKVASVQVMSQDPQRMTGIGRP
jgi:flagellar basal body-associated protein FliL